MITRKEIYGIVLAIIAAIVLHAYIGSVRDTAKADQVKQDVQQQISSMKADLEKQLESIARDRKEVKTPEQVIQKAPQYIPLPKPIFIQGPETQTSSLPDLPDAPSTTAKKGDLVIPQESASAFFNKLATCKEDELKLAECRKEVPLITQRAEAAEKAMKGGTFWSRTKKAAIYLGIGAAAGYALHR